ncbi:MAG: hypothetical protein PHP53_07400 [Prolixibacteraceae bacterium]|nr:hypothetical protein [Prolixibacteraceae bacterium]
MSFNYNFEDDNPENPGYGAKYDPEQSLIQPDSTITPKEEKLRSRPKPKTHEELLQSFYDVKEKAPEIDQAKVDRLRRMGRLNQLAQETKVLADIAGTAMGANVRKRQPDSTAPALFQSYQNTLDKYRDQTDDYNLRDFSVNRQNAQYGIQRADKETAQDFANRRQAAIEKNNEAKTALENSKFLAGLRQKQQSIDNLKEHNQAIEKSVMIRANKADRPKIIQTKYATHEISPAEYSFRRERALKNSELLKTRFKNMFIDTPKLNKYNKPIPGQFVTSLNPDIKDDDLVRADIEMEENPTPPSPEVLKQNEQRYLDQHRNEQGLSTKPVKNVVSQHTQQSAPKATKADPLGLFQNNQSEKNHVAPKVDYSKLDFSDIPTPKANATKKVPTLFQENPHNLKGVPKGGF